MHQVGLEELASIGEKEVAQDFMPAAITGLADGDFRVVHQPYTGIQAELYGKNHFGQGKVAQIIGRAAIENGMNPGQLYEFQSFAAQYFTAPDGPFRSFGAQSSVRIYPEAVIIDGNPLALAREPSLVIDYGACLTGRSYISDQIAFLNQGKSPFAYSPLTRLHFTNQTLINTYNTNYGQGTAKAVISNRLYIGREDGVAGATDEIIRTHNALNVPTEVADVILCTGAQHTAPEDLKHGIVNAHKLLRAGGMLVIRSLAGPTIDELGTEEISGWAFDNGFANRNVVHYEATHAGSLALAGHLGEREIQTLVLAK